MVKGSRFLAHSKITINTLCERWVTIPCLPFMEEEGPRTRSRVLAPYIPPQKPSSRKDCTRTHVETSIPPSVHNGYPRQSPHVGQSSPSALIWGHKCYETGNFRAHGI